MYGDAKLEQNTAMAIASLNAGLGVVVFAIGEGAITVTQAFGVGEAETVYGTAVYDGGALIHSCNIEVEQAIHGQDADIRNALLIAHELFHCLGFSNDDHSLNQDSLFVAENFGSGAIVDDYMVALFSDRYPEVFDEQ